MESFWTSLFEHLFVTFDLSSVVFWNIIKITVFYQLLHHFVSLDVVALKKQ